MPPLELIDMLLILVALLLGVAVTLLLTLLRRRQEVEQRTLTGRLDNLERGLGRTEQAVRDEIGRNRGELGETLKGFGDSFGQRLDRLNESSAQRLDAVRETVNDRLQQLQDDNAKKLEAMRKTVDEQLQSTLEKRLGEAFKVVSEQLDRVHQGLGEMQDLAKGVGDLKNVLTNVKTRGTWGEIQLGNLLEQVLAPSQYEANVQTKENTRERVEFAIRLPGRDSDEQSVVWLPIDAKFPKEDYERLVEAWDRADPEAVDKAGKQLEARIKQEAKSIHEKYLNPPHTTEFGILFLPSEGLYSEVLRRPGLVDRLQRDYRVNVAGPTTLAALLNSLQMGFRSLAIEQRSSEIWRTLGAVKTEFAKFGDVIGRVQKKLHEASSVIDEEVARRTRVINRRLREVQELPGDAGDTPPLLPENDAVGEEVG